MVVTCERCKVENECIFYGRAASVERMKAQNGEWLCKNCVSLRAVELDAAIAKLRGFIGDGGHK